MEPAISIISLFELPTPAGSAFRPVAEVVADICHIHKSTPYRWTWPTDMGGTGGHIPRKYHEPLLKAAKRRGLPLRREHFWADGKPSFAPALKAAE